MESNSAEKKRGDIPIIDASSLINLKAELLKKQETVRQAKLNTSNEAANCRPFRVKGEVKVERTKNAEPKVIENSKEEEDQDLRKSRMALEMKSKLYDKISLNPGDLNDTEDELYLVDFHRKAARKRNFNASKITDREPSNTFTSPHIYSSGSAQTVDQTSPPTSESSGTTHYQDVLFNEKRDHGVGYFSFSTVEEEREKQMDELNTLHEQTKKRRRQHEEAMEKKKLSLEARLAKICRRRNIDTSLISDVTSKFEKDESQQIDSTNIAVDLDSIPLPESTDVEKQPTKVRPWDVGKQFIKFHRGSD